MAPNIGIIDDGPIKSKRPQPFTSPTKMGLYDDLATSPTSIGGGLFASSLSSKLGLPLPNPAPDIGKNLVNKNNRLIYSLQKKILVTKIMNECI